MQTVHTIRLRGPWQYELIEDRSPPAESGAHDASRPPAGRQKMPADWGETLGPDFRGRVRYRRRFGKPTGLAPYHRLILVVEAVDLRGRVFLGMNSLGEVQLAQEPARLDITGMLDERNELSIEIELPQLSPAEEQQLRGDRAGQPGGLIGEVRLEICC